MKRATMMKNDFSPGQRLFQTLLALLMTLAVAVPAVFGAATLPPDAEYSRPRLAQGSQGYTFGLPYAWTNVVPNALASYFTYVPYSTADAVKLGFPATCGAVGPGGEDCYTITVKRFKQQLALPTIFGGGLGLKDEFGTYFGAPGYTDVYGYGSGGQLWTPPQFVANPVTGAIGPVAVPVTVTGNAPAPFTNGTFATTGVWHFPAPTIKGTFGRPVRVQWLNELPNTIIPGFDPTVDCSDSALNCFPYNRIVTHVHGAHVGPESDGLAHAAFNPDFSNLGTKFNLSVLPPSAGPPGTYVYPMDQEAATIWYHDHAVGATHTNVNQGMAGFFPITDDNEKCLQGIGAGCAKILPTGDYELGFALQDRIFYTDGQFAMPDAPVIDANFPTCDPATPASRLATCAPLFMYVKHAANAASLTPAGIHLVPYNLGTLDATIPENAQAPVLATSATLEFFGNMPVVNGVVYGKYDVEPRVYRIRFLGGTDSRTWLLQLQRRDTLAVIPLWMIGSEQGFLNNPVSMPEAHLMPGERLDFLVDFTGIPAGTKIVLNNLGPDTPFQGETIITRSVDIPEIMEFNTIALNNAIPNVPTPVATANLRPLLPTIVPLTPSAGVPVRVIALEEIVDEYGRVMPTIDRRGYDFPGTPATEIVRVNTTEVWDIINTTADAHTIHVHQVKFQVVHRQPFLTFTPAVNDPINNVFSQPTYTVAPGTAVPPDPRDAGFKDTDEMLPGAVTRIIATFDLIGEYVWHCHILSHEEHDMMRPMKIVALNLNKPVSLTVPAATTGVRTATVTIAPANPANPVVAKYYVEYKLLADTNWTTNPGSGLVQSITFPNNGTYQLRVKAVDAALSPTFADSVYTLGSNNIVATAPVYTITTALAPNGTLSGTQQIAGQITPVAAGAASVTAASTVTYTFAPNAGFEVATIVVDGVATQSTALAPLTSYSFVNVQANHYLNVYFRPIPNTISIGLGANGTVSGGNVGANLVSTGTAFTLTFVPAAGFEVASIVVDGVATQSTALAPITGYIFSNVSANHYLNVYFRPISNTITVALGANGTVSGGNVGANIVSTGTAFTLTFVPAAGFEVASIVVDGATTQSTALAPLTGYTFSNVSTGHYINVYFRPIPFVITLGTSGAGTVTVSGAPAPVAGRSPVATGSTVTYTFSPTVGNRVYGIVVDGVLTLSTPATPLTSYTFTGVAANHAIGVYFEPLPTFSVVTASSNPAFGTISQVAPGPIYQGANVTFNITPTAPHTLLGIVVDGVFIPGARSSYSFTNVQANHYISAYFQ